MVSSGTKCDGGYNSKTIWNYQTKTGTCLLQKCVKTLFLVGAQDIQADECIAKAKADPECSELVQHQADNGNGQPNGCECFIKDATCCGTCVPVDYDFNSWAWSVYTTKPQVGDPQCLTGVKSADNVYCCSASCKDANGVGVCMPAPILQVSFQDAGLVAPDGWVVDNGYKTGSPLGKPTYGWNCDLHTATEDRSAQDGTNYHSTVVKPDTTVCGLGTVPPTWTVNVPIGFYQVDTLYTKPFQSMRGCKVQGNPNYDNSHSQLGNSDMAWVSRIVNTTDGTINLSGGTSSQCGAYAAVVIWDKTLVPSNTYCQTLPGVCCPLFADMADRPCSAFEPPCKL